MRDYWSYSRPMNSPNIKIPARAAPLLGVNPSLVWRWNHGERAISPEKAMAIVDVMHQLGYEKVLITDIVPDLAKLVPYIVRVITKNYGKDGEVADHP